jgi:hypothetical protein
MTTISTTAFGDQDYHIDDNNKQVRIHPPVSSRVE